MSEQILQINFNFNVSRMEYEEAAGLLAPSFAELPGLRWKIWLMNADGSGQRPLFTNVALNGLTLNYAGVDEQMLSRKQKKLRIVTEAHHRVRRTWNVLRTRVLNTSIYKQAWTT